MTTFFVPGIPVPQGSKRAFIIRDKGGSRRPIMADTAKGLGEWRSRVALAAREAFTRQGAPVWMDGEPVALAVEFIFPRPKSLPKKGGPYVVRPDLSKLLRALEDGLQGVVFGNDAQVVTVTMAKRYCGTDGQRSESPGALVTVRPAEAARAAEGGFA